MDDKQSELQAGSNTKAALPPTPPPLAWWVALAHLPAQLIAMGEGQLAAITAAHEVAYKLSGQIATAENNRYAVKLAAVGRLMQPTDANPKGRSFTAAEGIASVDESYREYLNRLAELQVSLTRAQDTARVEAYRFRLVEQALRRSIDEGAVISAEASR